MALSDNIPSTAPLGLPGLGNSSYGIPAAGTILSPSVSNQLANSLNVASQNSGLSSTNNPFAQATGSGFTNASSNISSGTNSSNGMSFTSFLLENIVLVALGLILIFGGFIKS